MGLEVGDVDVQSVTSYQIETRRCTEVAAGPGMKAADATTWRSSDLLRAFALFFALWVALRFLWIARSIVLVTILSVLFAIAVSRAVDVLERWRIRRGLGTIMVMAGVVSLLIGAGFAIAPSLGRQAQTIRKTLPEAVRRIESKIRREPIAQKAIAAATQSTQPRQQQQRQPSGLSRTMSQSGPQLMKFLFPFLSTSVEVIAGIVLILFLTAYFAADPKLYRRGLIALVPPPKRARAGALLDELADLLRQWLVARLAAMVILGLVTAGALALLRVPAAGALGLIAGLLEFIPFVGPIAAAVPAVAMALVVSPTKAIYVVILFVILQQLEGNLLTPMLMKNRLDVPPAITVVAVTALGIVFGVLGMLLAEPLSAAVLLTVRRLYVNRMEE
jgi:predicted PurR-regulated permease PerM